jgi:type I restriction enzyme S subunit
MQVNPDGPAIKEFVLWHLRSGYLELRQKAAGGVQPNLNLGIIREWRISLPSCEEQAEIVRRIEVAFAWIDRLASEATSARKLIDRLDQSVLAKAFRGELVPQDPNDEPASVLLERIRTERAAARSDSDRHLRQRRRRLSRDKAR